MANFTALKTAINNAIKTNGNEEITGAVLQVILDAMVETLGESAITNLENALAAEVTNRENAVGNVASDLTAEALARANKDNQLDNRINQEEYNRQNADAALSRTIDQGFQALGSQMTALNAAISALNAAYQNGFLYGGVVTPSSSPSNNKCFYIALQGGTYTNFGGVGVVQGINILKNDNGWKVEHIYDQTTLLNEFYLLRQQVIQAITSFAPIVIQGDVTNAPDEEDLTSNAQHLLQFKNNAYSPLEFSGLGRKYLRKNIAPLSESAAFNGFVEGVTAEETLSGTPTQIFWDRMNTRFVGIKDGVYYLDWTGSDNYVPVSTSLVYMYNGTPYQWTGSDFIVDETEVPNLVNCLTQDMINEANTIYIIRYDFTLGENITVPTNCVLQFDGGSISGEHTIQMNGTYIKGKSNSSFNLLGTYCYDTIESFGVLPENSPQVNSANFEKFNYDSPAAIIFGNGTYNFAEPLNIKDNLSIYGSSKNNTILHFDGDGIVFKGINGSVIWFNKVDVRNLTIESESGNCIDLVNNQNVSINNALFFNLCLNATNGAGFYQTIRKKKAYSNSFMNITFVNCKYAFNHCSLMINTLVSGCVDLGVTIYFNNCNSEAEGLVCRDLRVGCNHTVKHFIFVDAGTYEEADSASMKVIMENCSFEEIKSNLIVILEWHSTFYIYANNCNFNFKTFAPDTNYVLDGNALTEVAFTNSDAFYPFAGKGMVMHIKDCAFMFYGTRTHKVMSIMIESPYYGIGNSKIGHWALVLHSNQAMYCNDSDICDLADLGSLDINLSYGAWIKGNRKSLFINTSETSKTIYIGSLPINMKKGSFIEIEQIGNTVYPAKINTVSTEQIFGVGTTQVGTQLCLRDTGIIKTYNGTNWVYPTGATV